MYLVVLIEDKCPKDEYGIDEHYSIIYMSSNFNAADKVFQEEVLRYQNDSSTRVNFIHLNENVKQKVFIGNTKYIE